MVDAHQFSVLSEDPKELKKKQKDVSEPKYNSCSHFQVTLFVCQILGIGKHKDGNNEALVILTKKHVWEYSADLQILEIWKKNCMAFEIDV